MEITFASLILLSLPLLHLSPPYSETRRDEDDADEEGESGVNDDDSLIEFTVSSRA